MTTPRGKDRLPRENVRTRRASDTSDVLVKSGGVLADSYDGLEVIFSGGLSNVAGSLYTIDWTDASDNLKTSGTGRFDGGLVDTSDDLAIDPDNGLLYAAGGAVVLVDWVTNLLYDAVPTGSVDWGSRYRHADDGMDVVLDWSTVGLAQFGNSNITTTGIITGNSLAVTGGSITSAAGTLNFGDDHITTTGNIGIGVAPSYRLHIRRGATDAYAVYVDGETNAYTDAGTTGYGLYSKRDVNYGTGNIGAFRSLYCRTIFESTDATIAANTQWVGIWSQVTHTGKVTNTTATNRVLYIDPLYFEVTDTGTWDHDSTGRVTPEYRGLRIVNNMDPNLLETGGAMGFMTYTVHGVKIDSDVNPASMTGGTWFTYNTGITINNISGTSEGTSRNEGMRIVNVSGADTNRGFVLDMDITADSATALGGAIVFGESQDASIGYNGTDLYINSDVVGSGSTKIGDVTNHLEIKPDGEVRLLGTARVKKSIPIANANLGKGNTAPSQVIVGNYNVWQFNINDDSVFTFHLPHDWAAGTDVVVNVDWQIDEAYATNSGEVRWQIIWSAIPHNASEAIDVAGTPQHSGDIDIPATARYLIETGLTIPGGSLAADDQIGITLSRVAIGGGNNPTADPGVPDIHIEYIADRLGETT